MTMDKVIFKDDNHRKFYEDNIRRTQSEMDPYRKAFFYTAGLTSETRREINDIYDYDDECIILNALKQPWQTGTSQKVTRLAYNLYNGYVGTESESKELYTPYMLFESELIIYMLEAVKILNDCYTNN